MSTLILREDYEQQQHNRHRRPGRAVFPGVCTLTGTADAVFEIASVGLKIDCFPSAARVSEGVVCVV